MRTIIYSHKIEVMENTKQTGKLVLAAVAGAALGAALGVLFAPHKGSKTRKLIVKGAKGGAEDVKMKLMNEANALRARAEELDMIARDNMKNVPENVKPKAEMLKHHN